ncbi:MAG: DNA polymerase III subunit delta [Chloroflexota bacterium]
MLYLLYGEDEFRRSEWLAEIRRTVAPDTSMADLNTVVLNGQRLTAEELEANCSAAPFLVEKRLVIVENLAQRAEPRRGQQEKGEQEESQQRGRGSPEKRMAEYLTKLPPTTDVVLAESRNKVSANNVFLAAVKSARGSVVEMQPPRSDSRELRDWVIQRAHLHGAQLTAGALDQLVAYAGNNLRLLDQELAKLAAYADGAPISDDDIFRLVSYTREASVFEMVDALGRRDARHALRKLHDLLNDGEAAQYLLIMIARQVRLLLLAREALDRGVSPYGLAGEMGVHPFVAQKVGDQARNFSQAGLIALHDQLVELDWTGKTGRLAPEAGLDLLIAGLARR